MLGKFFIAPEALYWLAGSLLVPALFFALPSSLFLAAEKFTALFKKSKTSAGIFFLLIFAGLLYVNQNILHQFMNSADEHSCYFLAECYRAGKAWVQSPELSEFFNVVHVGNRDGKWFSVYPYGWPLIWAAGLQLGIGHFLNPLLVTVGLWFFYKSFEKTLGSGVAFLAVLITGTAPFYLFTGASYFSHGTGLFTAGAFVLSYIYWRDKPESLRWAGLCALALGYGLATRYLTMAAIAFPFLGLCFLEKIQKKRSWHKADFLFIAIALFFIGTVFYQNAVVTGNPLLAPNKYDKEWERLGFKDTYTPVDGLLFIVNRFFYLMDWSAPVWMVLFFAGIYRCLTPKVSDTLQRLILLGFFYPAIGYYFYFSWGGNQYGPRYYYEGFPFFAAAVSAGFLSLWQKENLRKFLVGILICGFVSQGYFLVKQSVIFEKVSRQRKALYVYAEENAEKPALVFIHGFLGDELVMAEEDAIRNAPSLNSGILYAHDLGERNSELMARYPERAVYRGSYDRQKLSPILEKHR